MARTNVLKLEGIMEDKNFETWSEAEKHIAEKLMLQNESFVKSVIEQAKASAKRWFVAWLVTLVALVGTNAAWLYVFNSYEYIYQDGEGQNNYNNNVEGDVENVANN